MPSASSTSDGPGLATIEVHGAGLALPDAAQVVSMQVNRAFGHAASARLVMRAGGTAQDEWTVADDPLFQLGARIRVAAGYDGQNALVFEGAVVQLGLRIRSADGCELVVECRGDTAEVPPVRPGAEAARGSVPVTPRVEWGVNLFELDAHLTSPSLPGGVQASAAAARARVRGRIAFPGSSRALPGQRFELAGVGQRFSGDVFLTAIEHVFSEGNWITHAEFGHAEEAFGAHPDEASPAG